LQHFRELKIRKICRKYGTKIRSKKVKSHFCIKRQKKFEVHKTKTSKRQKINKKIDESFIDFDDDDYIKSLTRLSPFATSTLLSKLDYNPRKIQILLKTTHNTLTTASTKLM
jgi:hypothetical protein